MGFRLRHDRRAVRGFRTAKKTKQERILERHQRILRRQYMPQPGTIIYSTDRTYMVQPNLSWRVISREAK